ncbi:ATP-binding protein [Devosia limi]|nr:ATP-binding protein [Devosia limi]SHF66392.1 hypothetical protein SAMN02745223_03238 [Devosia limi DSM 17137]
MFRINNISLRASTAATKFGAEIPLKPGLNIVSARNSAGKSTALQAIIYGLGLERSLSPSLEVPLPYALRQRLHAAPELAYQDVISSHVELELQNNSGQRVLLHRDIVGGAERKLIRATIYSGEHAEKRDFFVHDPGAAQNEDGFHKFLEKFLGWTLPSVPTFDGREVLLYVEAIFPMLFVEQKRGWSTIQGPLPTHFKIQDLNRRVMEFLLDLDVAKLRRRQSELRLQLSELTSQWHAVGTELRAAAGVGFKVSAFPPEPRGAASALSISFEAFNDDKWVPLDEHIVSLAKEAEEIEIDFSQNVEDAAPGLQLQLARSRERLEELNVRMSSIRQEWVLLHADAQSLRERIATLDVDLTRNKDAAKLKRLGSVIGSAAATHVCPTCHQELQTELLPTSSSPAMAIEENVEFIRSQLKLCNANLSSNLRSMEQVQELHAAVQQEVQSVQQRIRQIRGELTKPATSVSRASLMRSVEIASAIDNAKKLLQSLAGLRDGLVLIAERHKTLSEELKSIGKQELSPEDLEKIEYFQSNLRKRLENYSFKSFNPSEISLSDDNFRPLVVSRTDVGVLERELGFEMSASDGIRMKWAYYLSLLQCSQKFSTNHPGVAVFDEPGQQAMELDSIRSFLVDASHFSPRDSQIIVAATYENVAPLIPELSALDVNRVHFDGLLLQPL